MTQGETELEQALAHAEQKEKLLSAYRDVFNNPQGFEVLRHLAKTSSVFCTTFAPGDPYQMAFNEGRRSVVMGIINLLGTEEQLIEILNQLKR